MSVFSRTTYSCKLYMLVTKLIKSGVENLNISSLRHTIFLGFSTCLKRFSLRRLGIVLAASLLWVTTACTQANTTANQPFAQQVPEKTEAAVERARGNLSDQAVDENVLSQQGESRARQSDGGMASP